MKYLLKTIIGILILSPIGNMVFTQNAKFQPLGDFEGGSFNSEAYNVSSDGSMVVGAGTTVSGVRAFVWTQAEGMKELGNLPDNSFKYTEASDISADGSVIVGTGDFNFTRSYGASQRGFIWTPDSGMVWMGSKDSSSDALRVSADGKVIVGSTNGRAYRWTESEGVVKLELLPGTTNSSGIAVSDDGKTITGSCSNQNDITYIWTEDGGIKSLGALPGGSDSFPNSISPDGSVVTGSSYDSYRNESAYLWTEKTGMVKINHLPGKNITHPTGVSEKGRIIVGGSFGSDYKGEAFIWDSTNGTRNLKTVLETENNINLTGWTLVVAYGISNDGNVIVGTGTNPSGKTEAFRIVLDTTLVDYFGQIPPGNTPEIFAPEIISLTDRLESKIVFSPDGTECYFQIYSPDYSLSKFYYTKYENGLWSTQSEIPFSVNNNVSDPFISLDGQKFFFTKGNDLWKVEKTSDGWGELIKLPSPINSVSYDGEYTETAGGTIYFTSNRTGGLGSLDIWSADQQSDSTWNVKNLGADVNSTGFDFSPCIAPDGSFLIFGSDRNGREGRAHLYISFNKGNNEWTKAIDMNSGGVFVNADLQQMNVSLSPDGKYIFFARHYNEATMDIYWVNAVIIDSLRGLVVGIKSEDNQTLPEGFELNQNYPNPFNPTTIISFSLPKTSKIKLTVYDILGREVLTLVDGKKSIGYHEVKLDASSLASGIYLYKLTAGNYTETKKMVLLR